MLVVKEAGDPPVSKVGSDLFRVRRVDLGVCQVEEPLPAPSHPAWRETSVSESEVLWDVRKASQEIFLFSEKH